MLDSDKFLILLDNHEFLILLDTHEFLALMGDAGLDASCLFRLGCIIGLPEGRCLADS